MEGSRRWVPPVAGLAASALAAATARGRGRDLDRRLYRAVNRGRGAGTDAAFKGITELGSIWAPVGAAGALARRGRARGAWDALGAAWAMWVLGQALKRIVLRPRPYDALPDLRLLIDRPRGSSWPSSHPAVLLAFVSVATRDLEIPPAMRAMLLGLVGLVGLSRVYLGVHYPADVAGGLLLGHGVANLWATTVSPRVLGRGTSPDAPGTVTH